MHTQTLTEVLQKSGAPTNFDLLSIDVEEHDLMVLYSLDLSKYSPKLIVVEDETFNPLSPQENGVYIYLTTKGYRLRGFVVKNLYFMPG